MSRDAWINFGGIVFVACYIVLVGGALWIARPGAHRD